MTLPEDLLDLLRKPSPWYGGRDQKRVVLTIKANGISGQG